MARGVPLRVNPLPDGHLLWPNRAVRDAAGRNVIVERAELAGARQRILHTSQHLDDREAEEGKKVGE